MCNDMRRKEAFFDRSSLEPSAGYLAAIDLNNRHSMRGVSNQMHDIANAELHGSLLIHLTRVQPTD
jgi:hypothetical protein